MEIEIGRGKTARRAYGFDDIAIVPSRRTRDPRDVDITWTFSFKGKDYTLPAAGARLGDGRRRRSRLRHHDGQARRSGRPEPRGHPDPLRGSRRRSSTRSPPSTRKRRPRKMQEIYKEPVKAELITQRVKEIKDGGVLAAASLTPQNVERYIGPALDGGLDILVIQGTVVSAEHVSQLRQAARPQRVRREPRHPVHHRRLLQLPGRAAPHALRRRRRARGRRPRPRVHLAPRARHRRAAGHRDRGRRRGAHALPRGDRPLLPRHRRRRHAHRRRPRQGHRRAAPTPS